MRIPKVIQAIASEHGLTINRIRYTFKNIFVGWGWDLTKEMDGRNYVQIQLEPTSFGKWYMIDLTQSFACVYHLKSIKDIPMNISKFAPKNTHTILTIKK